MRRYNFAHHQCSKSIRLFIKNKNGATTHSVIQCLHMNQLQKSEASNVFDLSLFAFFLNSKASPKATLAPSRRFRPSQQIHPVVHPVCSCKNRFHLRHLRHLQIQMLTKLFVLELSFDTKLEEDSKRSVGGRLASSSASIKRFITGPTGTQHIYIYNK